MATEFVVRAARVNVTQSKPGDKQHLWRTYRFGETLSTDHEGVTQEELDRLVKLGAIAEGGRASFVGRVEHSFLDPQEVTGAKKEAADLDEAEQQEEHDTSNAPGGAPEPPPYDPEQGTRPAFDADGATYPELQRKAKDLDVPAGGTTEELRARVKDALAKS